MPSLIFISVILFLFFIVNLWFIYKQKVIYKSLWEAKEQARITLYSIGDGVLITDTNGRVTQMNTVAEHLTGWKEQDAHGRPVEEVFNIMHEETGNKVENPIRRVLNEAVVVDLANHTLLVSKDGKEIPIADRASPIKTEQGELSGAVLVFRDQSKERAKQKMLEESEERQRLVLEAANLGTWDLDLVNDKAVRSFRHDQIWGYTEPQSEWGLEIAMRNVVQEDRQMIMKAYEQGIKSGFLIHENRVIWPDKSIHWIRAYGRFIYNNENKPVRVIGIVEDITERKQTEEQLIEQKDLLQTIFDNVPAMITVYDPQISQIILNKTFEKLTGWTNDDVKKNNIMELVYPDPGYRQMVADFMLSLHQGYKDFKMMTRHGQSIETSWANIKIDDGRQVGIGIDITERKMIEQKLISTMTELERSNKDLEKFAYVASHDLQEPIRMIKIYAELLKNRFNEKMSNDEREFFGFITDGAARMSELVNALLQYSRINRSGKEFGAVDCNYVIEEVLDDLKFAIHDSEAVIKKEDLPVIKGDKTMIRLLFQNLIQNAIKFNNNKRPEVAISKELKDGYCLFRIKDNGIGIPAEYYERIFVIFQRLHVRDKYPGTGVGLALCKRIVELHGGRILVESEEGRGSTFSFALPMN